MVKGEGMYKLKKKDFYDIYGISLFLHKLENPFIVYDRLMEIANKYIEITDYAIRTELRYLNTGGFDGNDERLVPQDRLYIKNIRKYRKNCSLNKACSHFREHRRWHKEYGGGRWALIVNALQNLIKNFEDKKLNKIVVDIDHLNDLEHNNCLYLSSYSTFNFVKAGALKKNANEEFIIHYCSSKIQQIYNRRKSLIGKFHLNKV